jgi:hypothetical protein
MLAPALEVSILTPPLAMHNNTICTKVYLRNRSARLANHLRVEIILPHCLLSMALCGVIDNGAGGMCLTCENGLSADDFNDPSE